MRSSALKGALVLIVSFTTLTTALEALADSPCAPQCGNVLDSTGPDDIVCQNADYSGTPEGIVFQNCITCQLNSTYQDPVTKQTDLQWALYNLRYATSFCLFGYNNPQAPSTPCITAPACGPLQNMFEADSLSPNASAYSYCALENQAQVPKCQACLTQQQNDFFLTNFVTALVAACAQQPTPGKTITIEGSLFSLTTTNITSPTATPSGSSSISTGGLSLGSKVGIAVGAIVLILAVMGFCIVWNGKRRRRAYLLQHQDRSGYAEWANQRRGSPQPNMEHAGGSGPFFDSPQSQRPLVPGMPWGGGNRDEESPATAMGEKVYFSPYSSQYNSPVSATDQVQIIGREWPIEKDGSTGLRDPPSRVRSRSKEKRFPRLGDENDDGMAERIELQNVAPVLMQPKRHRRSGSGLTEEDAKRGDAL